MRRTSIYNDPELEVLLKLEKRRQKRPMAEIVREAVQAYVTREPRHGPPGAGAFSSGQSDTASRVDEIRTAAGFGAARAVRPTRGSSTRSSVGSSCRLRSYPKSTTSWASASEPGAVGRSTPGSSRAITSSSICYLIVDLPRDGYARVAELNRRFEDLDRGFVDAAIAALAGTLGLSRIATTNRRHFEPLAAALSLQLLP